MLTESEQTIEEALGIIRGLESEAYCVVSHPDAGGLCGSPAVITCWGLPFCERHGAEAMQAALWEAAEDAEHELETLEQAESCRRLPNQAVMEALKQAAHAAYLERRRHESGDKDTLRGAYPPIEGRTDPETQAFDYESERGGGTPVDWWSEQRWLLTRFLRLAMGRGSPELVAALEPLRERACAQLVLADEDYERRWLAPRRAGSANASQGV